jgi:hypothetical protein
VRRRDPTKITVGVALGASIAIAVAWFVLRRGPAREPTIAESARSARVVRHDAMGLAVKDKAVRDPARVAAIVAALGVDGHAPAPCPADYGSAEVTIVLSGGGERAVLTVSSAGCRRGAPRDRDALVREIEAALE